MTLTFYTSPMSTATLTELVLAELDIPHERVVLDIRKGETRAAEFRTINPNAKVPVVVHDGAVIWESAAITMYLGETFGVDKGLYPAASPARGEAMKWIVWTNVSLGDCTNRWSRNTQDWYPAEQRNAAAGEVAKADLAAHLQIVEDALHGREFLLGNDYSLADTHLSSILDWLRMLKVDFTAFPTVEAWSARCRARPAYGKVMGGATA